MRIKRIEIEGFKSYSNRQAIDNLDPQFNAITGLNGSGKSNILDAICFLLGITNLQQVRAHSLTDLVYKQGQAGINRATVTITFDNDVPADQKPVGYEKYREIVVRRQIIINGRNTYQINGAAATNVRVTDLFRMVGINVNNPHFLIMQGRITKVLNMKPAEILSMVEEAAGVRMYESKKLSALKTIEKKETKVQEISRLMDEDILPRVEKLKQDRTNYMEYQRLEGERERLERKLVAFDYFSGKYAYREMGKTSDERLGEIERITTELEGMKTRYDEGRQELDEEERSRTRDTSDRRETLEEAVREVQQQKARVESEMDARRAEHRDLGVTIERKLKSVQDDTASLEAKHEELCQLEAEIGDEEKRHQDAKQTENRARNRLEAIARGMYADAETGQTMTLDGQINAARTQLSGLETETKLAEMKINQLNPSLEKKRVELGELVKAEARTAGNRQSREQLNKQIAVVQNQLGSLNFDPVAEPRIRGERTTLLEEKERLRRDIENFEDRNQNMQLNYTDPDQGFDRQRRVKGVVGKLFRPKDMRYAIALEVVAGGRIANIIVDTAKTAELLLQRGRLARRVTFLPLDKIDARGRLGPNQVAEARRLVGGDLGAASVFLAKDLIEYDPELEPAMQHIFGSCLICETMDQAKALTFNPAVGCRTVTVSGEDYKPSGVLTGGSRPPVQSSLLQQIQTISVSYERRQAIEAQIAQHEANLQHLQTTKKQFEDFQSRLNELEKAVADAEEAMKHNPLEVLRTEVQQLEEELTQARRTIDEKKPQINYLKKRIPALENKKNNEQAYRDEEKRKAQAELDAAQHELNALKDKFIGIREKLPALREEVLSLERSIADEKAEIGQLQIRLEQFLDEIQAIQATCDEAKVRVQAAESDLEAYITEVRAHDKQLRVRAAQLDDLKKESKKLEARCDKLKRDQKDQAEATEELRNKIRNMEKGHPWIAEEKQNFGVEGGPFDFRGYTHDGGKREIDRMRDRAKSLLQTVNTRAMHLLDTAEEQCQELERKREQLLKDKRQLYETIEQLDEKKKRELIAAHKQISADFGSIYSTLLPGASAELVPPEGSDTCLDGLQFRVAFSGKYKESLLELSGGQRSLVALSLILAMLKFRPAPFYILDEVDAALDLSHTEHIGKVIKNHFTESQFIVVSLKDGFFNNANVLFRTKFVDGTSTVTRIQN